MWSRELIILLLQCTKGVRDQSRYLAMDFKKIEKKKKILHVPRRLRTFRPDRIKELVA